MTSSPVLAGKITGAGGSADGATQRHDQLGEPTEGHRDPFQVLAQVGQEISDAARVGR